MWSTLFSTAVTIAMLSLALPKVPFVTPPVVVSDATTDVVSGGVSVVAEPTDATVTSTATDSATPSFTVYNRQYDDTVLPVATMDVVSMFGPRLQSSRYDFHRGIDIAGVVGEPVYAIADGEIYRAYAEDATDSPYENSGNVVILRHTANVAVPFHDETFTTYFSFYGHLDTLDVALESGDGSYVAVKKGQRIGTLGRSGTATFPHLHFETRIGTLCSRETQLESPQSSCAKIFTQPRDPQVNPLVFLPYADTTSLHVERLVADYASFLVTMSTNELDFDRIVVTSGNASKVVALNERTGIDPALDNPFYDAVRITPFARQQDSATHTLQFDFYDFPSTASVMVQDIAGNATRIP